MLAIAALFAPIPTFAQPIGANAEAPSAPPTATAVAAPFLWNCLLHYEDGGTYTVAGQFEANERTGDTLNLYRPAQGQITEDSERRFGSGGQVTRRPSRQAMAGDYVFYSGVPGEFVVRWEFKFAGIGNTGAVVVTRGAPVLSGASPIVAVGFCAQRAVASGTN
jgi:hypothetical protein